MVKKFCHLLELASNFSNNSASHHLTAHMFAAAHMILKLAPPTESKQTSLPSVWNVIVYWLDHLIISLIYGVLRKYPDSVEHSKVIVMLML